VPRKSAGRIGAIVLKSLLVVLVMALPISAEAPGVWTLSANLNTARANHAAAMLPNGEALIVGGTDGSGNPLTSAEIYSLSSNTFTAAPTGLTTAASGLTATVLNDNSVLLAGGVNSSGSPVAAAGLYDPTQNAFTALPAMNTARSHHTATLLNNGTVLIAGGSGASGQLASLEIYNPTSQTFSVAADLRKARQDHTATLLTDGTVLIAGGADSSGPLASAEIFNPTGSTVTEAGSLSQARTLATASMLLDLNGDVLIEGGQNASGTDLDTVEEYNPATNTFTALTAQMITARSGHLGLTLPYNGKVLIAGGTSAGHPVTANELYDPITGIFVANEPMSTARDEFAANFFAVPAVGQVLMSGGLDSSGNPLALTEMFSYPTIRTDKSDYPPGSPVIIYGAGFAPGEQVITQIQESDSDDTFLTDTADSTGSFTAYNFGISDSDGGVKFLMTAAGQTSGQTAQDKFTDTKLVNLTGVTVAPLTRGVTAGQATAKYNITVDFNTNPSGGTGTATAALTTSALPPGATANFSPSSVTSTGTGTSRPSTLNISTVCGTTPPGPYTFTVTATGTAGDDIGTVVTSGNVTVTVNSCAPSLNSVSVAPAVNSVHCGLPSPNYIVAVDFNSPGAPGGGTDVVNLSIIPVASSSPFPAGTIVTFTPASVTGTAGGVTGVHPTLSITVPCGTAVQNFVFQVQATATGGIGSNDTTVKYSNVVTLTMHGLQVTPYNIVFTYSIFLNTGTTTTPARIETVLNNSAATINIGQITATTTEPVDVSPSPNFLITADGCSNTKLTVGKTCTVDVDFTATALGNFTGTLNVPSDASNGTRYVGLKGTGIAGLINLSPSILFPNTVVGGTSAPKTATLTNPNSVAMSVFSVTPLGDFAIPAATDHCSGNLNLAAGASCTVGVTFTPTATGTRTGSLTIISNARNSPATITLQGTGK
jgi:N-acetylneuraminic acid mutarotase